MILPKIFKNLFKPQTGRLINSISYFGFADALPSDPLYKEAYEVSKHLTSKGFEAINGGGPGIMRAVSEGAKDAGGDPLVITFYPKNITNFEGRDPNNPAKREIVCKNYLERTLRLLEEGDAYVIFRGGTGTVSEFGMAWGLARLYFGHHKPLILYGDYWHEIINTFISNMRIRPEDLKVYKVCSTPEEVHRAVEEFESAIQRQIHIHRAEKAFQL
ncbi:MAG: LOG family protein [Patescibacteria group bacterium]